MNYGFQSKLMWGISDWRYSIENRAAMETKRIASDMQTKYCGKLACQEDVVRAPQKGWWGLTLGRLPASSAITSEMHLKIGRFFHVPVSSTDNNFSWVIVCSLNHLFTQCYWSRID